jgi:cell wall-associated NlpC family hydrolase
LAAAGVAGAEYEWTAREPFEDRLADNTTSFQGTKRDHQPGVVFVWRNHEGLAEHAAVTIGDGYVLNKPSQAWFSPRVVWTVQETIAASRYRGVTLTRNGMPA